jgi:[CysO sulfur-carrier protein]-S-L-cysteine hydrolase
MVVSQPLIAEIVEHALQDAPNECCGVIGVDDGAPAAAVSVHRAVNVAASPLRFEIDGLEVLRLIDDIEREGLSLGAIYHSHTRTAPYPSQTDINFAAGWPGVEWVIVGVANRDRPEVRSYLIDGPDVAEVSI